VKAVKIILLNVLVAFFLMEAGLRVYHGLSGEVPPHADSSVQREWSWVRSRLRDGKLDLDARFVHDPHVGWRNAPSIDVTVVNQGRVRTNSNGMRNHQEVSLEPAPGTKRLLILGDSYAFGFGVDNEETFAYVLDDTLPGWEVLNFAVSATGTDQNLLMYEHHGRRFNPDVVLLGFYVLDYNRNTISFRDYAKPMFRPDPTGHLELLNVPVIHPLELVEEYRNGRRTIGGWHYSYLVASLQQAYCDHVVSDRGDGALGRRVLSGLMGRFAERVRADGAEPLWVNIPTRGMLEGGESTYRPVSDFALAEARHLGMPVVDLEQVFRDSLARRTEVESLWRPEDVGGHLSAEGHRVAAIAIRDLLESRGLVQ